MSTEGLQAFLGAAYAVRWILVAVAAIALGLMYADALAAARRWKAWAEQLEDENDALRGRARRPVVALPPRRDGGVRRG